MTRRAFSALVLCAVAAADAASLNPSTPAPGAPYQPPTRVSAPGAPLIFEHGGEAGPDETFLLVGERLTTNLVAWGVDADAAGGQEWRPRVQFFTQGLLAATLPERAYDGPFLVWVQNSAGFSAPIVLNAPQVWWCGPDVAVAGDVVRLFGRNLARRPDFARAFVYLRSAGGDGTWVEVLKPGKYSVAFRLPSDTAPGAYEVWVHAGAGGDFGWSGPVTLQVKPAEKRSGGLMSLLDSRKPTVELKAGAAGDELQKSLDALALRGGGTVALPAGIFPFSGTLRVPTNVTLRGAGPEATTLQLVPNPAARFARLSGGGWDQAPGRIHSPGDTLEYQLEVPTAGAWDVWLRYATDMAPWNQPGVSGNMALSVDEGAPVPLLNLTNTGGFGAFRWVKSASLSLGARRHKLIWRNNRGGGISLDAFVFALDSNFTPSLPPAPTNGANLIVLQAEDCERFVTKEGVLPGGDRAALWLSADGAGVADLTVLGTPQVNYGIALCAPEKTRWINDCRVERVRVADCEGKHAENCGLYVRKAQRAIVRGNELWGRAPLFLSGAMKSEFVRNRLVPITRFGGNAEAAILGRTETIEQCIFEENRIASPAGAEAGGPTTRRLLWFSTGHGSITMNWIANNGVEPPNGPGAEVGAGQARFGGVAGTDQNVGEMILMEANHRTAYFGRLAAADAQSVTLPKTLPATPDNRLGSVTRNQLAHDAAGNETPFWPPDFDDGTEEPPIFEYYVTVLAGRGQGQTRRVARRESERLSLDRPWSVTPARDAVVTVATAYYRNHIVANHTPDGMTGIQLWISCVENIVAGNSIARQRKPGFYLYANGTTLASSMPRTWNRGISPLFWNVVEGNRTEECSAGALVISGDSASLPVEFPRALGNVLRRNSFIRNRTDGVILTSRRPAGGVTDTAPAVAGTIVEFNVVRDAQVAYHAAASTDATVLRRNHAYFWYPVSQSTNAPVAFQIDSTEATASIERNSIEGIHGTHDGRIIDLKRDNTLQRLPEQ